MEEDKKPPAERCRAPGCFDGQMYDSGWYGEHPDNQDGWTCPVCKGSGVAVPTFFEKIWEPTQ